MKLSIEVPSRKIDELVTEVGFERIYFMRQQTNSLEWSQALISARRLFKRGDNLG
jgi:hypothetical protein